jgi:putative peptidoglycan lipid II flippase
VLLPNLAGYAKSFRWNLFNEQLISAMDIIALITIPVTFFSLAQGEILIRLLFQNRSFDENSVALTLSAFTFHMPGLFFIALNRILAPAFYAQSNSKSPTLAGIISFAVNMLLAALLVRPFRGAGIALALSIASAVNTILLLAFLRSNPHVTVGRALGSALIYTLKLSLLSAIAVIPLLLFSPRLLEIFADRGRIITYGIPLAINGIAFCLLGIVLLLVTRDRQLKKLIRLLRLRKVSQIPGD